MSARGFRLDPDELEQRHGLDPDELAGPTADEVAQRSGLDPDELAPRAGLDPDELGPIRFGGGAIPAIAAARNDRDTLASIARSIRMGWTFAQRGWFTSELTSPQHVIDAAQSGGVIATYIHEEQGPDEKVTLRDLAELQQFVATRGRRPPALVDRDGFT
jgi:hypothetical protein